MGMTFPIKRTSFLLKHFDQDNNSSRVLLDFDTIFRK